MVAAALRAFANDESLTEPAAGDWETLLAEGEASGAPLDGETVLKEFRAMRAARQNEAQ